MGRNGLWSRLVRIDLAGQAMEGADSVSGQAAKPREHRRHPRYLIDGDSSLLFVDLGLKRECKIIDLSLEGCRIRTRESLPRNAGTRVEAFFKVKGMAFRFNGILRWTDGRQQAGIQFVGMIPRCRADLAELIGEIEAAGPKKTGDEPVLKSCAPPSPPPQANVAAPPPAKPSVTAPVPAADPAPPQPAAVIQGAKMERRAQIRHEVDTSVLVLFVRSGVPLAGRIVDLSLGGCRIRTQEKFPVGIYTRVEIEFRLCGLPFRLGGVIQAIHSREIVGVRFLDLSDRKRQQVSELIEEIKLARMEANGAGATGTVP